ncbi:hypothetical protein Ocin01_19686 [Orchesella cincta]|uniref:Uncharacterized protein n=1 Tax=Orchesella cincta TaxID=48709 RepID=A0A1D2M213_ORCCI|nr:hypothetical protein Ocin01_19686 [Orchesella cincta]
MSANKRLKTDLPTSELRMESQTSPKTTVSSRLYTLVPGTQKDSICSIYPILPNVGCSLVKETLKFDSSKEVCYHFALTKEKPGVGGSSLGFKSNVSSDTTSLKVLAADTKSKQMVSALCFSPERLAEDIMGLNHVATFLASIRTGDGIRIQMRLNPGVTSNFAAEASLESPNIARYIVYHGAIDKTDPQWCSELAEFLWYASGGNLPTVQIKGNRVFTSGPKGFELYPQSVLTPFSLLDKEGNKHACHKECWKVNFFINLRLLVILGSCTTVDLLLQHLYHPLEPIPPITTFEVAFETMKLAQQLELTKLLATAVKSLVGKLDLVVKSTVLRELYVFIRQLKFKIQIFAKLWKVLLPKIKSQILEEDGGGNGSFDREASFLNFKSFTKDGYFLFEVMEELCQDLMKGYDFANLEEVAQQLKIQMVINRFKGDVIRRMGFKLAMGKIKL